MTVIWLFGGPLVGMIEQWSSYMIDRRTEKGMLTGLWGQGDRASPAANVTRPGDHTQTAEFNLFSSAFTTTALCDPVAHFRES